MRNLIILSLLMTPFLLNAQRQTEYNRRGNEAMESKDYELAMYWYEQGVANCDRFSIDQLTAIWNADPSLHGSMRIVMGKCLNCLNDQATSNKDTLAIKKLIDYHSEGIGTPRNEANANYWKEQLEQIRNPVTVAPVPPRIKKERMKFFAGYHASLIAPFGIQIGGMSKSVGWYMRYHSNFVTQNTQYNGDIVKLHDGQNYLTIKQFDSRTMYHVTNNRKSSVWMGSVGIVYKATQKIHVSAGAGYWERKYFREFIQVNGNGSDDPATLNWAKDNRNSKSDYTIDLDGMYVISGKFYGTLGGSLLSFKYAYPNIGIGVFF